MVTAETEKQALVDQAAEVYGRVLAARETTADFGELVAGWPCEEHHRRWCAALDDERIKKIIIIAPPSGAKTTWIGVTYVAKQVGKDPTTHLAYLTYNDEVAQSRSVAARDLTQTPEFKLVYPGAIKDKRKGWGEKEWYLQRPNRGDPDPTVRAAGLFGAVLAYHFNELVLDDPHDPEDVLSKTMRERAWNRIERVVLPRLRPDARMVVTGFRWAEDDIPGYLMGQGYHEDNECNGTCGIDGKPATEWHVVHTKAIVINERTGEEESYWEEEWPVARLQQKRSEVGASTFACQYQGLPAPEEGHIFKWERTYKRLPADIEGVDIALDTAYTEGKRSDYTAAAAWAYDGKPKPWKYLVEGMRGKWETPEAYKMIAMFRRKIQKQFPMLPVRILVRQRVAIDLIAVQHLRAAGIDAVAVKMPGGGEDIKKALAKMAAPEFESGRMLVPEDGGIWLDEWRHEHKMYPQGQHDDYVETTIIITQRHKGGGTAGVTKVPMKRTENKWPVSASTIS